MNIDDSAAHDRMVAFTVAVYEVYTAIQRAKRMAAGSGHIRSKALLRLIEDIETHVDTIYTEAGLRQTAVEDITRITHELRQSYDQLSAFADTAYHAGYQDALKEILDRRG